MITNKQLAELRASAEKDGNRYFDKRIALELIATVEALRGAVEGYHAIIDRIAADSWDAPDHESRVLAERAQSIGANLLAQMEAGNE